MSAREEEERIDLDLSPRDASSWADSMESEPLPAVPVPVSIASSPKTLVKVSSPQAAVEVSSPQTVVKVPSPKTPKDPPPQREAALEDRLKVLEAQAKDLEHVCTRYGLLLEQATGRLDDQYSQMLAQQRKDGKSLQEMRRVIHAVVAEVGSDSVEARLQSQQPQYQPHFGGVFSPQQQQQQQRPRQQRQPQAEFVAREEPWRRQQPRSRGRGKA